MKISFISSKTNSYIWKKTVEFSGVQTFCPSDTRGPNSSQGQERGQNHRITESFRQEKS